MFESLKNFILFLNLISNVYLWRRIKGICSFHRLVIRITVPKAITLGIEGGGFRSYSLLLPDHSKLQHYFLNCNILNSEILGHENNSYEEFPTCKMHKLATIFFFLSFTIRDK